MISFELIEEFVNQQAIYVAKTNSSITRQDLLDRFLTFQYKSEQINSYSKHQIVQSFNYVIELWFIATCTEFECITISDLNTYHKQYSVLRKLYDKIKSFRL